MEVLIKLKLSDSQVIYVLIYYDFLAKKPKHVVGTGVINY